MLPHYAEKTNGLRVYLERKKRGYAEVFLFFGNLGRTLGPWEYERAVVLVLSVRADRQLIFSFLIKYNFCSCFFYYILFLKLKMFFEVLSSNHHSAYENTTKNKMHFRSIFIILFTLCSISEITNLSCTF